MMHLYSPFVLTVLMYTLPADFLQLPAFNQRKLSLLMLNLARRILFGFNGATTITLGDITLPVQVGPVTQQVLFSIVEDLGPYNCLVGRAWLHLMKVISSTYHQMVSYLTSVGQVNLLSIQPAARQCYQLSIREQREEKGSGGLPLWGSHSRVETIACHPSKGERKESVSCGSSGDSSARRAREIHICQHPIIQQRKRITTMRIVGERRCIRLESLRHGWD